MIDFNDIKSAALKMLDEDGDGDFDFNDARLKFIKKFDKDGDQDVDKDDLLILKLHHKLMQAGKDIDIPGLKKLLGTYGDEFIVLLRNLL